MEGVIQMKVLFAVNSENISDAIIKKYQRDYREILSYKNVYYFNAIQKEIQKDKSYDRIVISADLEPFSNNNYESIDKFIFEKLDGISDEAHDTEGNEISIILICSDRHTKGSSFLVKLFGLGIYNALLGNDRSMEEVCRLINKPRTKKEAKMYYKIDTDDVNYRTEHENEVDELQIQNILFHFRKLGKNTEKYASSFENIAAQYTDEQLKIIINCLPINVKRVLEGTSNKYREIMTANGMMLQGVKSSSMDTEEDQKRTGLKIDIIENKLNQTKMTQPIVIPNSVKSPNLASGKRVVATQQNSEKTENPQAERRSESVQPIKKVMPQQRNDSVNPQKAEPVEKLVRLPNGKIVKKKFIPKSANSEESQVVKTVKPERKITNVAEPAPTMRQPEPLDELDDIEFPDFSLPNKEEVDTTEQPKRGRGRPRKNPVQEAKPKGTRGRPRKNPIEEVKPVEALEEKPEEKDFDELPDLETITEDQLNFTSFDDEELMTPFDDEMENESIEEDDFSDFLEDDEEIMDKAENSEDFEENTEEVEIPELDELDDITEFDEDEEEKLEDITEEAFDEFNDYDEYGQYETKTQINAKEENIDELYQEDILSDIEDDFEEIEPEEEDAPEFDMQELDELEEISDDEYEMELEESDAEEDNRLLSDFEEEDDILSDLEDSEEDNNILDLGEETDEAIDEGSEINGEFEQSYSDDTFQAQSNFGYNTEAIQSIESPIDYSMSNLNSLMTKDKKIVTFLGSTKNGVSFLVNNLAELFASVGINTAILDMTQNRNSYYIYTQNEESLRQIAYTSIDKLQNGMADGIRVKQNLTVYTALPNDGKEYPNVEGILSSLVQNHSLILIDCDFNTNPAYFASCQEIYLVQSMDILTIQPLTAFLRDLKAQGVFEPEKVRVVINKELKVRGLTNKAIIGGMSSYNDPAMSFMTELFNKEIVKYCSIPFEEMAYSRYLEGMLNCKVSISGYSKNFMNKLRVLGDMVYPLTSRQTYSSGSKPNFKQNNFSNSMNDTLNKMKRNY